jgi:glycogen debranching enzyme
MRSYASLGCTGSMDSDCLTESNTIKFKGKQQPCLITPLTGSRPHAFMMDCTHDNESPSFKRTTQDALSTGALVAAAYCAVGSNKGFDDFYPKLLNVVSEKRHYEVPKSPMEGVGGIKRILNHLHTERVLAGFTEGHLHQENDVRSLLVLAMA